MAATKHLLEMSKGQHPFLSAANSFFMNPLSLPLMAGLNFASNPLFFGSTAEGKGQESPYSSPQASDVNLNQSQSSIEDQDCDDDNLDGSQSSESKQRALGHRNQKRPIPNDQKDGKYFERRRRNNLAAKKSRDARKTREDQLAMRVAHLEKENAIFRAQVAILREEMSVLQLYLCQKANGNFPNSDKESS